MRAAHRIAARLRDERGSVLITFVVALPVLILMGSFVIDVANWFEHKRHLQMQADAAALAAGGEFTIPCADDPILAQATDYHGGSGARFNPQVSETDPAAIHMLINSRNFFDPTEPADETVVEGAPCDAKMVDVKLTETDVPWFLRLADVDYINAQARVEIRQRQTGTGLLPIAVNDVDPRRVKIEFVNEDTDAVIADTELEFAGNANGLALWDNALEPLEVPINAAHVGVRVYLSGTGEPITNCTDALVTCYDAGSADGLLHIQGWSGEGNVSTGSAPIARSVRLVQGSCDDPYFTSTGQSCSFGARAQIDFPASPTKLEAKVWAVANGNSYPLTYSGSGNTWEGVGIPLAGSAGPVPVSLRWAIESSSAKVNGQACKKGNANPCVGSFGTQQRAFAANDDRSGPVKVAQVLEEGLSGSNSFQRCTANHTNCTHNLVVRIGLTGNLENAQGVSDPIHKLRLDEGNQNQAVDCDPDQDLRDSIAYGCTRTFTRNTGTDCPAIAQDIWSTPQPHECVGVETGIQRNKIAAGLNLRILGAEKPSACTAPNNWSEFPNLPKGDPRIVDLFLTPFGSFEGTGNETAPVINFATFYVTGWDADGDGFGNPCQDQGDDPAEGGEIVGHYIKYISPINEGGAGEELCDFEAFGSCVAVLTN